MEVSYRQLLSKDNSVYNPLRTIAHIDLDAAYAAIEGARLGIDPSVVPLCVQQWQGLIAVGYAARKFGITRHETPEEALKKCPHLLMVHVATYGPQDLEPVYRLPSETSRQTHKASLDTYRRESLKVVKIYKEYCSIVGQ